MTFTLGLLLGASSGIIAGMERIKCPKRLRQYGADWAQEIKDSGRRDEIELRYKQRMKEITNGKG